MSKTFWMTFGAVLIGIFLYSRYKKTGSITGTVTIGAMTIKPAATEEPVYYGPFLDPVTGAYLGPGAQPGTSSFPSQPVGG